MSQRGVSEEELERQIKLLWANQQQLAQALEQTIRILAVVGKDEIKDSDEFRKMSNDSQNGVRHVLLTTRTLR